MHASLSRTGELWNGGFVALLLLNLLLCLGFYMLPVTLPAYVTQIGGSAFEASLVIGAFSAMSLLSRVASGTVVETFGEATVIRAGLVVIAATTLAMIFLPVGGILLARALQGVGWGMATAAIATAVYTLVPAARRGEGSGYYALTGIAAVSLTPLVAILLLDAHGAVAVLGASAALTVAAVALVRGGRSAEAEPVPARPRRRIGWRGVFERGALLPAALCAILSVSLCGVMAYLVLFGREQHIDGVWLFFVGYTLMILATRGFVGRLFDRRGHAVIVVPGGLAMVAGLVVLSYARSAPLLVVASLLYGGGYGAVQPSLQTWAVNRCPDDRKAAANGLFLSSIDLGYIVGAVALGQLAAWQGYAAMYRYAAASMVAFLAVYLLALRAEAGRARAGGA